MGALVQISVPAERITPIPGEDYTAVPTNGAIAGRQWVLERLLHHPDSPTHRLHRRDCWQARSKHPPLTTAAARELLDDPENVDTCDICHPERALHH